MPTLAFQTTSMAAAAQAQVYTRSYCILTRFTWLCPLQLCMKLLDLQNSWKLYSGADGASLLRSPCFLHLWTRQQYESCKYTGFRWWAMLSGRPELTLWFGCRGEQTIVTFTDWAGIGSILLPLQISLCPSCASTKIAVIIFQWSD